MKTKDHISYLSFSPINLKSKHVIPRFFNGSGLISTIHDGHVYLPSYNMLLSVSDGDINAEHVLAKQ